MSLSGASWVRQYPTSTSTSDLTQPFRTRVENFLSALQAAGASVTIEATLRPPQRAYLMHYSFRIAREGLNPASVPALSGVDIQWVHMDARNHPDLAASRAAASAMVSGFGIVFRPALKSLHTQGEAIDMDISWSGDSLTITGADGRAVTIRSRPHTGANPELQRVGAGYLVYKLPTDPPHWSINGH